MAIALDINLLCKTVLDAHVVQELLADYSAIVKSIHCMDNWRWENERLLTDLHQANSAIRMGKIVTIQLKHSMIKDAGIYIEKEDQTYLYTVWINTHGYSELDCDVVTDQNRCYYAQIYRAISKLDKYVQNALGIIGIGLETDFHCSENAIDTVRKSRNILAWILTPEIQQDCIIKGYHANTFHELDRVIWEKFDDGPIS